MRTDFSPHVRPLGDWMWAGVPPHPGQESESQFGQTVPGKEAKPTVRWFAGQEWRRTYVKPAYSQLSSSTPWPPSHTDYCCDGYWSQKRLAFSLFLLLFLPFLQIQSLAGATEVPDSLPHPSRDLRAECCHPIHHRDRRGFPILLGGLSGLCGSRRLLLCSYASGLAVCLSVT